MKSRMSHGEMKRLAEKIRTWVREKNAIILAHNYQMPEVQDVADLTGDSLELSLKASQTDADIIVFCGVHFMAETASILCPDKKVLLPVPHAGCPMADMITARALIERRQSLPNAVVVSYVNTTAEVKAESDICCTSANVVQVVESLEPDREIYMTPDKNLAQYTMRHTTRKISYWDGYCPIHNSLTRVQVMKVKAEHPDAVFLAHPECPPEVLSLADVIKSTSGMLAYVTESEKSAFIIGTEVGILYPMKKANPEKIFIPADPRMICPDMKKTGLPEIVKSLEVGGPEVKVPELIRIRAKPAIDRMLAVPRG